MRARHLLALFLSLVTLALAGPMPVEEATKIVEFEGREGYHLSPNGEWLAYTVSLPETVKRYGERSKTGAYLGSGAHRRQARVTHLQTGQTLVPAAEDAFSWGPIWSPDGSRLALFSDEGGRVALKIWNLEDNSGQIYEDVVPRNQFYFQNLQWHPNGKAIALLTLPDGVPLVPDIVKSDSNEITIWNSRAEEAETVPHWSLAQVSLFNINNGSLTTLTDKHYFRHFRLSPDGQQLAYSYYQKDVENSQTQLFALELVNLAKPKARVLSPGLPLRYGSEWSWSPDGKKIAYFTDRASGGKMGLLDLSKPESSWLLDEPNLKWTGERFPVWGPDSEFVYAVDSKVLWQISMTNRTAEVVGETEDWGFEGFFLPSNATGQWLTKGEGWLHARHKTSGAQSLWTAKPNSQEVSLQKILKGLKVSASHYKTRISPARDRIILSSYSAQNPGTILSYLPKKETLANSYNPNSGLQSTYFGQRKVLEWEDPSGAKLKGVLLLPPDYEGGPLPTVLSVYGGKKGTWSKNTFGMGYYPVFNFEILASRGYAVFEPELPIQTGTPLKDTNRAINSACDHLVAEGYADPERFALMGQSFGSYTVLCALVKTQRFKAAVLTGAIVFPDLFTGYSYNPSYFLDGQGAIGKTPWEDPKLYKDNSPFFEFDRIETPILIGQGSEDFPEVSQTIYRALKSLGKDVELRIYPDEGHVIAKKRNVADFWNRRLEFFEKHLK